MSEFMIRLESEKLVWCFAKNIMKVLRQSCRTKFCAKPYLIFMTGGKLSCTFNQITRKKKMQEKSPDNFMRQFRNLLVKSFPGII